MSEENLVCENVWVAHDEMNVYSRSMSLPLRRKPAPSRSSNIGTSMFLRFSRRKSKDQRALKKNHEDDVALAADFTYRWRNCFLSMTGKQLRYFKSYKENPRTGKLQGSELLGDVNLSTIRKLVRFERDTVDVKVSASADPILVAKLIHLDGTALLLRFKDKDLNDFWTKKIRERLQRSTGRDEPDGAAARSSVRKSDKETTKTKAVYKPPAKSSMVEMVTLRPLTFLELYYLKVPFSQLSDYESKGGKFNKEAFKLYELVRQLIPSLTANLNSDKDLETMDMAKSYLDTVARFEQTFEKDVAIISGFGRGRHVEMSNTRLSDPADSRLLKPTKITDDIRYMPDPESYLELRGLRYLEEPFRKLSSVVKGEIKFSMVAVKLLHSLQRFKSQLELIVDDHDDASLADMAKTYLETMTAFETKFEKEIKVIEGFGKCRYA